MPKKKTAEETPAQDNVLVSAAKSIGAAAGKIASKLGATPDAAAKPKSTKPGKLQKKNKARLPRRQKKALKKAAAKSQDGGKTGAPSARA